VHQSDESLIDFMVRTCFLVRSSPMTLVIGGRGGRVRWVVIVRSIQYIGIRPVIGSKEITIGIGLEKGEVDDGHFAEIQVLWLGQTRSIVPLP